MNKKFTSHAHILAMKITAIIAGILIIILIGMIFLGMYAEKQDQVRIFQERVNMLTKNTGMLNLIQNPTYENLLRRDGKGGWRIPGGMRNIVILDNGKIQVSGLLEKEWLSPDFFSGVMHDTIIKKNVDDDMYLFYAHKDGAKLYILYENLEFTEHMRENVMIFSLLAVLIFSILLYFVAYKLAVMTIQPMEQAIKHSKLYNHYLAHELKTPLAVMQSDLALAKKLPNDTSYIESAFLESKHLQNIIDGLLFVSEEKTTLHKLTLHPKDIFLSTQKTVALWFPEATLVIINTIPQMQSIRADEKLFSILAKNLLENIYKYAKEDTEATITYANHTLFISNILSKKIDSTLLWHLFEPFFWSGEKGSGLGLSIVKRICELHGWEIQAQEVNKQFQIQINMKV